MISLREQGEYYRLALAMGLIDPSEITAWADHVISKMDAPPGELMDVSLAGRKSTYDIMRLLAALPGHADLEAAAHRVLGLLRYRLRQNEFTLQFAAKALDSYYQWAVVPESEGFQAHVFYDALFCATHGNHFTLDSVRTALEEFFDEYSTRPDEF